MMANSIISFSNNRGNYMKSMQRLETSLQNNFNGKFIGFTGEASIGAPLHTDNPYAFKVYAFKKALELGYRKILYLDSSVYAVSNVQPVFDLIEKDGYVMQEAGQYCSRWTNQNALDYFDITREDLGDQVMYGNAGLLGLNFETGIANHFFLEWNAAMMHGAFKGDWADHRHDMACGSIIANRLGMKFQSCNELLEYAGPDDPVKNNTIIFRAQGM